MTREREDERAAVVAFFHKTARAIASQVLTAGAPERAAIWSAAYFEAAQQIARGDHLKREG